METALVALLGCSALGAASTADAGVNFPQPGMNAAHTGYNASETVISAANVASLVQTWSFTTGAEITAQPILVGKNLYVLSQDGNLYALNATTGKLLWSYPVDTNGTPSTWAMVADAKQVYTNCQIDYDNSLWGGHGGLCALNAKTGALNWSYAIYNEGDNPVDSAPYDPPVLVGSTLYFGEADSISYAHVGYLVAIDKSSGQGLASVGNCGDTGANDCNFISSAPPAAMGGGIFYNSGDVNGPPGYTSLCREPLTLAGPTWCYYTNGGGIAPSGAGGKILFVQNDNAGNTTMFGLKSATGAVAWSESETPGAQYFLPPAVANGVEYVLDGNGSGSTLYALNAAKGTVKWQYASTGSAGGVTSGATVANGVVYAQCTGVAGNGNECAFDATTGSLLRIGGPGGATSSTPIVANGYLYTVCGYNSVCALTVP